MTPSHLMTSQENYKMTPSHQMTLNPNKNNLIFLVTFHKNCSLIFD